MLSVLTLAALLAAAPEPGETDQAAMEARHLKNIRQVTFDFARAGEGYFRPDGRAVIFQAARPGESDYQIYTLDLAPGATPRMVSTGKGKCTCAYYHPKGKGILFASTHLDAAPADPSAKKGPAYSRSERYRWDFDPAMDIFRADADGSNLVRLTDTPGYDAEGSYSADGTRIIFTSFRDGDAEVYVMDADGTNPRRLTRAKGYDGGPFFSPDGKKVVYRSDRKQNDLLQIYLNNPEGTAERALTANDAVNWGPFFLPDSRRIVYSTSLHGHRNYEIYLMDTETGRQERVTYRDGFDALPVVSPDGKRLLWTSKGRTADDTSQLFLADFEPDAATPGGRPGLNAGAAARERFFTLPFVEDFMHAKEAITRTYAMGERVVGRYLDGLSDADLLLRPVEGQNHIAWQLGHLILSERSMLEGVKPGSSPKLPDGFEDAHGRDESSTRSDDAHRFLTKDQYVELMKAQREATRSVLEGLGDADLDAPGPERFGQMAPTVGAVLLLVGTHVLMHVGQFVSVRRSLHKPLAI